jgi:hypothetical protein
MGSGIPYAVRVESNVMQQYNCREGVFSERSVTMVRKESRVHCELRSVWRRVSVSPL